MVKDYNELKDIAKKLMLENNYGIKEEELIYVTTTDITDYYERLLHGIKLYYQKCMELMNCHSYIITSLEQRLVLKSLKWMRMIIKRI